MSRVWFLVFAVWLFHKTRMYHIVTACLSYADWEENAPPARRRALEAIDLPESPIVVQNFLGMRYNSVFQTILVNEKGVVAKPSVEGVRSSVVSLLRRPKRCGLCLLSACVSYKKRCSS